MMGRGAGWLLLLVLVEGGTVASGLTAQGRGSLVGTVVDGTEGQPMSGATASLYGTDRTVVTDDAGRFVFSSIPAGEHSVTLEKEGYVTISEGVSVPDGDTREVRFRLTPLATVLDELMVFGRQPSPEGSGGVETELAGGEESEDGTAADLLAQRVPGLSLSRSGAGAGSELRIRIRGNASMTQSNQPSVYVDGVLVAGGSGGGLTEALRILDEISASDVQGIRVLQGPAASARYPNAANGVILVETRTGSSPRDPDPEPGLR